MDNNRVLMEILSTYLTLIGLACGAGSISEISNGEYMSAAVLGITSVALLGRLLFNTIRNIFYP